MSYQDQADLAQHPIFGLRLGAALAEEARGRGSTGLAALVMRSPAEGARVFMPFIASAPGFGAQYALDGQQGINDGMILSAIQASWADVEAIYFPPTEPTEP